MSEDEQKDNAERPLPEHTHPDNAGLIFGHSHAGSMRAHCHVDDGPAGRTLRDAGWSENLPLFPERHPDHPDVRAG